MLSRAGYTVEAFGEVRNDYLLSRAGYTVEAFGEVRDDYLLSRAGYTAEALLVKLETTTRYRVQITMFLILIHPK